MQNAKETRVPFMGTYSTQFDDNFERQVEYEAEHWADEWDYSRSDVNAALGDLIDWRATYARGAKCYVESIVHLLQREGVELDLKFREMTSPREYNFTTDRIWADVDLAQLHPLRSRIDRSIFDRLVHENFTSRSGFVSFYSDDADDLWEIDFDSNDCDSNQLCIFLEALIETTLGEEWETAVLDNMSESGDFSECLQYNPDELEEKLKAAQ